MDELEVIKLTLNNTIARHAKKIQEYEVEIANLTAQLFALSSQLENSIQMPPETMAALKEVEIEEN